MFTINFVILCSSIFCLAHALSLSRYTKHDNFRTLGTILAATSVSTAKHCAVKCVKHAECGSYNVGSAVDDQSGDITCEILHVEGFAGIQPQIGWNTYVHVGKSSQQEEI